MIHLTGQNYNAREIIKNIFAPLVSAITSPLADELCYKNNLSFVELIQPFARLANDAHFRDSSGTSVSIKGLRLNICDIGWRPPQTVLARKMLNEAVTKGNSEKMKFITVGSLDLEVPSEEPWFENWRETFLTVQFPSDHEFTRHFLSCIIVLASSDPNILETANQLTQKVSILQNITPQKLPKWFQPTDVLNTYVLLHDASQGDISKAQQSYELLKSSFGEHKCFLLQINSSTGSNPGECHDYWSPYLKRQSKTDTQSDQGSAPKTPQDSSSVTVTSMPTTMQLSNLDNIVGDSETFLHPLSPVQEQATEAIHSKFSSSSESLLSQSTINPNVWASEVDHDAPLGICLNQSDIENLRHFVQDYTMRALIPYVERLVASLNEAITNKKGVSKSLLSATKRWFVTNKPGAGTSTQNAVIYTNESVELQTRKLGDLYFMFGHYNLAFQAYHQAKRDFNADSAWQYYAGALEMAAISAFMLGTSNRKTYDYMEDAIVCYLNVCKLQQFATRATLLSIECLKTARLYGEAAKQLIRMTSEESDLRSALLLEQAAYCFLASQPAMHRKYAFHIVLSGNRYSRAGQRKHAFRCYKQAYQVFQDRGWSLAEDHIQYTIGKQAYSLKKLEISSQAFAYLLRSASLQNTQQQVNFLKEYILTQKELLKRSPELGLLEIALPKVVQSSLRVLVTSHPPLANPMYLPATNINIKSNLKDEPIWQKLEEMLLQTASSKPVVFKPSKSLFTCENPSTDYPLSVHGEPIEVSVSILNTIKSSIIFSDIDLLWEFTQEDEGKVSNKILFERECSEMEKSQIASAMMSSPALELNLEEHEEKTITFKLTPKLIGRLRIIGLVGRMSASSDQNSLQGCLFFETQQIKIKDKPAAPIQFDNKLTIQILPPAPSLNVCFSQIPTDILAGEIIPVTISLRNSGISPIADVFIGCDSPRWITLLDESVEIPLSILRDFKDLTNEALSKDKEVRKQHVFKILKRPNGSALNPQEVATVPMWIQAPYQKGTFKLRLLFYYGMPADYPRMKYRLVRHEWEFNVHECLQSEINCVVSNFVTNDLGLDVSLKNMNQVHHALATELYVDSVDMYCPQYKVNSERILFMNQMEISQGQLADKCLKSSKSASLQCRLLESPVNTEPTSMLDYVRRRLSSVVVTKLNHKSSNIPPIDVLYSFLMKNETKFLNVFNFAVNTEEFNSIVSTFDPHMTIAITWTALVIDGNSAQRTAQGQHFIPLRHLYEPVSCPETADYRMKTYLGDNTYHKIYEFTGLKSNENEDEDQWEFNNNFVGRRCLLEDESSFATASGVSGKVF